MPTSITSFKFSDVTLCTHSHPSIILLGGCLFFIQTPVVRRTTASKMAQLCYTIQGRSCFARAMLNRMGQNVTRFT